MHTTYALGGGYSYTGGGREMDYFLNIPISSLDWLLPAFIISIIVAVLAFFVFMAKKNETKFSGFLGWLYDFWHFRKLIVEGLLKFIYIAVSVFITIMSFSLISFSVWAFLLVLIGGNLVLRIFYELILVQLIICRNTSDINKKMNDKQQ